MSRKRPRLAYRSVAALVLMSLLLVAGWIWWAESFPETERELRVHAQDQLEAWFPEEMQPVGVYGLFALGDQASGRDAPRVVLIHGLDEPGNIWDELTPALERAGFNVWDFRYPNDQAIDRSAELLAEHWSQLEAIGPVVLIGHSMGGLVARDFVTRLLHPEGLEPIVRGPRVAGVILVGTPNQGSDWSRLRIWLELREQLLPGGDKPFSWFASLHDGTGAAKIDLRPGSVFLQNLNERKWPTEIPLQIIGGVLLEPPVSLLAGLESIGEDRVPPEIGTALLDWWSNVGDGVGDGVVSVASLEIQGAPDPILVSASHRGLLVKLFTTDSAPPAIAPIVEIASAWIETQGGSRYESASEGW